jgi:hypothetical protein
MCSAPVGCLSWVNILMSRCYVFSLLLTDTATSEMIAFRHDVFQDKKNCCQVLFPYGMNEYCICSLGITEQSRQHIGHVCGSICQFIYLSSILSILSICQSSWIMSVTKLESFRAAFERYEIDSFAFVPLYSYMFRIFALSIRTI